MEALLHQLLQTNAETEILEYKEAKSQYDKNKLGRYFSALSNEANLKGKRCAWMILGVNDKRQVVGTAISDQQVNDFQLEISQHTSPCLCYTLIHRVKANNREVLMFEIPPAPVGMPVAWKGMYYGRDGESLGGLNILEIEAIRHQNKPDWSAQTIPSATLQDLSTEAILLAKEKFLEKNPQFMEASEGWDDMTFLNKSKICIQSKITNAAILLLGKPESEHFISPAVAKISWILKDRDGIEKDYEHFSCPFLLNTQRVYSKIRNIRYRYLQDGTLFPDEVDQFDPYIIREGLNNCIAHQDYTLGGKINVIEREDGVLVFSNLGEFIPQSIEKVIESDAPESKYRNPFLSNAMVNLKMIDTIGSGIKKMFLIQKNKLFPLPEYDLTRQKVTVTITGKVIDVNYARKLAQLPNLSLPEIILLDKVSKKKKIRPDEIRQLKEKKLIEGRKPNFYISASVAKVIGEKADYIKQRGIDDDYCMKLIKEYLIRFKTGKRSDFEKLLIDKLPDVLALEQKQHKIKNLLQKLKRKGIVKLDKNRQWALDEI